MQTDVVIIGAGAAGLFAASQIAKADQRVILLDNGKKVGRKILMSGGGLCNFTNLDVSANNYLSNNPHFVKSALAQFSQWDFIALVDQYKIKYHEKELGQLFTDAGANQITNMLLTECKKYKVDIQLRQNITQVERLEDEDLFQITFDNHNQIKTKYLVIATGGLSMPALGATPYGYKIAEQFGLKVITPRASLVPFTWRDQEQIYAQLSGISLLVTVESKSGTSFTNQMLFTHRGLSGPAILQISNYWQPAESVRINLLPSQDIVSLIKTAREQQAKLQLKTLLARELPKKLVELWLELKLFKDVTIAQISNKQIENIHQLVHHWQFIPNATEGYRTAEVTKGGVDTHELSSKTMQANKVANLYFIGEVVDVTGWLGGYNLQWAWSSAFACASSIRNIANKK